MNSRVRVPGPWGNAPVVFASSMEVRNFAASFELSLNNPALVDTPTGLGMRIHQVLLHYLGVGWVTKVFGVRELHIL